MLLRIWLNENEMLMFDEIQNIVGNIAENMLCFSLLSCFNVENKKIYCIDKNRTNRSNPNYIALVWFGSDFILKVNRIKPYFFLSCSQITFNLKIELNHTANTPSLYGLAFQNMKCEFSMSNSVPQCLAIYFLNCFCF